MSSVIRHVLKLNPVRAASLSFLLILVACSSMEETRPLRGLVSVPARSSKVDPHKIAPLLQFAHSSTNPESPLSTHLGAIADSATSESKLERANPSNGVSITSISSLLSFFLGANLPQETSKMGVDNSAELRSQGMEQVIGYSFEKRPITSYYFGYGHRTVIFVGGIHGGYEWNTILLAYQAIDYFIDHPDAVPDNVTLIIVPSANPDGQYRITGKEGLFEQSDLAYGTAYGRYNARGVDLNRNWDCGWESTAWWRDQAVSGGKKPFSEPESRALRDFFLIQNPEAVIFWHSKAGGVYAAGCQELFQPAHDLAEVYGSASGYPVEDQFAYYEVTGDASDWLSTQRIPSITVELASHDLIEWPENLAGMMAVLNHFNQPEREAQRLE